MNCTRLNTLNLRHNCLTRAPKERFADTANVHVTPLNIKQMSSDQHLLRAELEGNPFFGEDLRILVEHGRYQLCSQFAFRRMLT
jgi:hypothetical protein